ncbi:MAG TPA: hypothetical protein VF712_18530 [Thermoleophilaceae bacterium]
MIGRLRDLAERPIADSERRRLFALAVAVLALTAAALLTLGPAPERRQPAATKQPVTNPAPAPPALIERSAPAPARATRAARQFLASWLRFLYGHAGARELERATPQLRRRLSDSRLRVPPAARRRRPRVVQVEARRTGADEVAVSAEIEDGGVARYPVAVTMRRTDGGWRAVAVGAD